MTHALHQDSFDPEYQEIPDLVNHHGYLGSNLLKKVGTEIEWTPARLREFDRCAEDPIYFAEKYMTIVSSKGKHKIILFDYQKDIIRSLWKNSSTVAECARQSGKTTAVTCFVLWYILFHEDKNVGILANKAPVAREILARIKMAYENLPLWLQQGVKVWNKGSIEIENGCRVMAAATSNDSIRGFSMDVIFIDEAAWIENWEDFYTSTYPVISSREGSRVMLVSTVNGLNHFYKITSLARQKKNGFHLISVTWKDVPGRDEKWRQKTLAEMNFDEDKFEQEFENRYLGSSGTLISGRKLGEMFPAEVEADHGDIQVYNMPEKGHIYVCVCDVSRGKLLDYSAFSIFDVTELPYKQVATYRSNEITPTEYAQIINGLVCYYNRASTLIEINDIGEQVADLLRDEYEYENILLTEADGRRGRKVTLAWSRHCDRGIRTTIATKALGCSTLKLLIENNKLIVQDYHTIEELKTFSRKGKSYEAEEGNHDDMIVGLFLFAWLTTQDHFKLLTDTNALAKVRDLDERTAEQNLLPFGIIDDGSSQEMDLDMPEHNSRDVVGVSDFDKYLMDDSHEQAFEDIGKVGIIGLWTNEPGF